MVSRTSPSRRVIWIWGIGFIACCAGFAALRCRFESLRQRDQLEWRNESRLSGYIWYFSLYNIAELRTRLGAENVRLEERIGTDAVRVVVPGAAIHPRFRSWSVSLLFGGARGTDRLAEWHVIPEPGLLDHPSQLWYAVEYTRLGCSQSQASSGLPRLS
jgi:hypothetical protein